MINRDEYDSREGYEDALADRVAELENDVNAAAWALEWMVADKYRKPDAPAIIAKARKDVRKREDRLAELEAALTEIRDSEFCSYERVSFSSNTQYETGVTDGHRYCSSIARKALEKGE